MTTLALDFGTSNSAAALWQDGRIRRLSIETGSDTLPTAVFFPSDKGPMRLGLAAAMALLQGEEGRYMRALKSVLGSGLFHETRMIGGKRRTLSDVVTAFLAEVKSRAEAEAGQGFTRILSGRPVHFHPDPARDAKALEDLTACYHAAGFAEVDFLFEPEAAALAAHASGGGPQGFGLIVDIGGGTSDYSLYETSGAKMKVLASHGIRLGGTDFDHAMSMTHAMPWLGRGSSLHREMGAGEVPMPNHLYVDLSTWARIPLLYTPDVRNEVAQMVKLAIKPRLLRRLAHVLQAELGHEIAFAVERGKINANAGREGARVDLSCVEPGLGVPVTAESLEKALRRYRAPLREAAAECCRKAGIAPDRVAEVVLVGGSSLMAMVGQEAQALCPNAALRASEPFTAVVDGLALATA
ncbi:Hsp70 family protein [Stagnihabitans tardus]|uniref:Hsp70 family protein n=1 Tax=Stagnihabitans tardus TaxID=2699202 RepID=A0AAE5BUE2_9RHOB|nr:Hsp70 family protein [Stagnihabitans tardus]NBZ87142.1 Hsp70 family protein [Stagnihabitans tardus]